jgi:hypothetical protein
MKLLQFKKIHLHQLPKLKELVKMLDLMKVIKCEHNYCRKS